jgi:aryl-alcohol dehydrogenase-like predicted oxidoreductase
MPDGDFRADMPRFQGDNLARNLEMASHFRAIAKGAGCSMAQLCIAWVLSRRDFIVPIPGTTLVAHLNDLLGAFVHPVSADALAAADTLFPPNAAAGPRYTAAAQAQVETEVWEDEPLA